MSLRELQDLRDCVRSRRAQRVAYQEGYLAGLHAAFDIIEHEIDRKESQADISNSIREMLNKQPSEFVASH